MKIFFLILISIIFLPSCEKPQENPFPYAKHEIEIIGYENIDEIVLAERSYKYFKPDVLYYLKRPNAILKFKIIGPYTNKFDCSPWGSWGGELPVINKDSYFEMKLNHKKINQINISCRYNQSDKEKQYYKNFNRKYTSMDIEYKGVKTIPYVQNLDYKLLDQFGFSPYTQNIYTEGSENAEKYFYKESRDKENIMFIDEEQNGLTFFYDENGFTNITMDSCYGNEELQKELEKLGNFIFKKGRYETYMNVNVGTCGSYIKKQK